MRKLSWTLAACLPFAVAGLTSADEQIRLPITEKIPSITDNQRLADELARRFESSGRFQNYSVNIEAQGGIVSLAGLVADEAQRQDLLSMTRRYPGVVAVNDQVRVVHQEQLMAANYQPRPLPVPAPTSEANALAPQVLEPAPLYSFAGGVSRYSDAPVIPPYSWPAYTPYNNFASMAYQTQYPSGAWPFIGPPYPYPMIPSGWRSVNLKWKAGYWWLKFRAH